MLITGGAGFIGGNFVKMFPAYMFSDTKNVVLDKLTYASNIEYIENEAIDIIQGDICDSWLIRHILKNYNPFFVINFAAETHVDRSIDAPDQFIQTNIVGTHTLLEECLRYYKDYKPQIFKFIQISTDEVYGPAINIVSFKETCRCNPTSPYAASKTAADYLALSYYKTFGLPVVITRSTNNFGPNQCTEKFIPLTIMKIINGQPIPIYGNGLQSREWIFVEDNCLAIKRIIECGKVGEIYNIGCGIEFTNIDIANKICNKMSKKGYDTSIEFVEDRPAHDVRYAVNNSKLVKLGWAPLYDFDTALEHTINWYINNHQKIKKFHEKRLGKIVDK